MQETRADRNLLLTFFLTFSRFEYALKACGFFKRPNSQTDNPLRALEAQPDWDRFAISLRSAFQPNRTEPLKRACEFISDSPPWKQVIVNGAVAWETPVRPVQESEIEFLLRMVRCVRNNLFHGGKHNIEVHENTERTTMLLRSALVILEECLALAPQIKHAFNEATI